MKTKYLLYIIFLVLLSVFVTATSLSSRSTGLKFPLTYRPGFHLVIPMAASDYANVGPNVSISVGGDLGQTHALIPYFQITDVKQVGSDLTTFNLELKLPDTFEEPGMYYTFVSVSPKPPADAKGIFGIAAVRRMFAIRVLLQQKAITAKIKAHDVNVNETVKFLVPVNSETYSNISNVFANIVIYDKLNNSVGEVNTNIASLESDEGETLKADFDTTGLPPSTYYARALVRYDELQKFVNTSFRIGTLTVKIINHTKEAYRNEVNEFFVDVESGWNDPINNIYAEVEVGSEKRRFKTTTKESLPPWKIISLDGFLDTTDFEFGEHDVYITVYFEGNSRSKHGTINIVESPRVTEQRNRLKSLALRIGIPAGISLLILLTIIIFLVVKQININNKILSQLHKRRSTSKRGGRK